MNESIQAALIADVQREFANQRRLAERAIAQLNDEQVFQKLDGEANSVAILMKHVGGNLRSRWQDFLTTDGEKLDRNRDGEFVDDSDDRASVTRVWETGWSTLDSTLQQLSPNDLAANVTIRGETMPAYNALNRSLAHTAQHIGQIIMLAKHWCADGWQTLSIARGKSAEFNKHLQA